MLQARAPTHHHSPTHEALHTASVYAHVESRAAAVEADDVTLIEEYPGECSSSVAGGEREGAASCSQQVLEASTAEGEDESLTPNPLSATSRSAKAALHVNNEGSSGEGAAPVPVVAQKRTAHKKGNRVRGSTSASDLRRFVSDSTPSRVATIHAHKEARSVTNTPNSKRLSVDAVAAVAAEGSQGKEALTRRSCGPAAAAAAAAVGSGVSSPTKAAAHSGTPPRAPTGSAPVALALPALPPASVPAGARLNLAVATGLPPAPQQPDAAAKIALVSRPLEPNSLGSSNGSSSGTGRGGGVSSVSSSFLVGAGGEAPPRTYTGMLLTAKALQQANNGSGEAASSHLSPQGRKLPGLQLAGTPPPPTTQQGTPATPASDCSMAATAGGETPTLTPGVIGRPWLDLSNSPPPAPPEFALGAEATASGTLRLEGGGALPPITSCDVSSSDAAQQAQQQGLVAAEVAPCRPLCETANGSVLLACLPHSLTLRQAIASLQSGIKVGAVDEEVVAAAAAATRRGTNDTIVSHISHFSDSNSKGAAADQQPACGGLWAVCFGAPLPAARVVHVSFDVGRGRVVVVRRTDAGVRKNEVRLYPLCTIRTHAPPLQDHQLALPRVC